VRRVSRTFGLFREIPKKVPAQIGLSGSGLKENYPTTAGFLFLFLFVFALGEGCLAATFSPRLTKNEGGDASGGT
tara:strand:+ start:212 stop:436 length:225 start_codon:yes stop_codon:yes gene_type:complete